MLLRSRPDTVHRFLLRKTQTSTSLIEGRLHNRTASVWHHPCSSGLQVQGTAISPAARYPNYTKFLAVCQPRISAWCPSPQATLNGQIPSQFCHRLNKPWNFSRKALAIMRKFDKLRHRMIPYLYSAACGSRQICFPVWYLIARKKGLSQNSQMMFWLSDCLDLRDSGRRTHRRIFATALFQ